MTEISESDVVRDSIKEFSLKMEKRLQDKDWKGGWDDISRKDIFTEIVREMMSLLSAIQNRNSDLIVKKSIDVANYAMMMHDNEIMRRDKTVESKK